MDTALYYDADILTKQIVFSAIVVWAMRLMKGSDWPIFSWISEHSYTINRTLAILASGAVSLGLHWNYGYSAADSGTFTLTITGVSIAGILDNGRDWIFSYIVQQTGYRLTEPAAPTEVAVKLPSSLPGG